MSDIHHKTTFQNPFERRRFNSSETPYRSAESTIGDIEDRMNIYPDIANQALAVSPYISPETNIRASPVDMMLAMK